MRVVEHGEPELGGGPQHPLLAQPREMHAEQREVEERFRDEVPVAHRVERVLERRGEPEIGCGAMGIERQGRARQGPRAQRRHVEPLDRREQAIDVARQRPAVGEQVMSEQHGLRALHVRVAGEVRVARVRRPIEEHLLQRQDARRDDPQLALAPQPQRCRHLVVSAPARVELAARRARDLGDPAFDRGVDVLV